MKKRWRRGVVFISVLTLVLMGLVACEHAQNRRVTAPAEPGINATYGHEEGNPAPYTPGTVPGIALTMNFAASGTHRTGQPWGDWTIDAYWRREPRTGVTTVKAVPVTIDETGQGRALLPASFLDAVFADAATRYQASGDTSTWHHSPGLHLHLLPLDSSTDYYDLDPKLPEGWTWKLNSWSFAGSLESLVQALQLGWYPGLSALTGVAAQVDLGDPLGLEIQPPPDQPTTTPTGGVGQCNGVVSAGGDAPETHTIQMGATSGTFAFYYQSYSVKDQMLVTYEGTLLYDTGCVGATNKVPLSYSGTSTSMTIQVIPNCTGGTGTAWEFSVGCPN